MLPKIIKVTGRVAKDGSLESFVETIPPIKTITGDADAARGCAIKRSQMFFGSLKSFDRKTVVSTKTIKAINMLVNTT